MVRRLVADPAVESTLASLGRPAIMGSIQPTTTPRRSRSNGPPSKGRTIGWRTPCPVRSRRQYRRRPHPQGRPHGPSRSGDDVLGLRHQPGGSWTCCADAHGQRWKGALARRSTRCQPRGQPLHPGAPRAGRLPKALARAGEPELSFLICRKGRPKVEAGSELGRAANRWRRACGCWAICQRDATVDGADPVTTWRSSTP